MRDREICNEKENVLFTDNIKYERPGFDFRIRNLFCS